MIQRHTPLPRSTKPIARTAVKKRRAKPRRVSVVRDQPYMDWLKTLDCIVCVLLDIRGVKIEFDPFQLVIDPAHTVGNGRSSKGPDDSCIPLCRYHHSEMDGRLSTNITTKAAFADKYGLDLAVIAAEHYARYKQETT